MRAKRSYARTVVLYLVFPLLVLPALRVAGKGPAAPTPVLANTCQYGNQGVGLSGRQDVFGNMGDSSLNYRIHGWLLVNNCNDGPPGTDNSWCDNEDCSEWYNYELGQDIRACDGCNYENAQIQGEARAWVCGTLKYDDPYSQYAAYEDDVTPWWNYNFCEAQADISGNDSTPDFSYSFYLHQ